MRRITLLFLLILAYDTNGVPVISDRKSIEITNLHLPDLEYPERSYISLPNSSLELLPSLFPTNVALGEVDSLKQWVGVATGVELDRDSVEIYESSQNTLASQTGALRSSHVRREISTIEITPHVSLVHAEYVFEGEGLTVSAILSESLPTDLIIPLNFEHGTTDDSDYHSINSLRIPSGSYIGTATIQSRHDSDDLNETFTLSIGTLPSGVDSNQQPSMVTIIDDDKPALTIQVSPISEGPTMNFMVTVGISEPLQNELEVPLVFVGDAIDSADPQSVTIPVGERTAAVMVLTNIDRSSVLDGQHLAILLNWRMLPSEVTIGNPWYSSMVISASALPRPLVTLSASPNPVQEGSRLMLTATVSPPFTRNLNIPVIFPPTRTADVDDFEQPSLPVTVIPISAGASSGIIPIQTNHDADRQDEMFDVWLWTPDLPDEVQAGDPNVVTVVITDNKNTTVDLSVNPNPVTEGNELTVYATLSETMVGATKIPLILTPGQSTEESDFSDLSSITIDSNQSVGSASITAEHDSDRSDESFTIALDLVHLPSHLTPGTVSQVVIEITDDDHQLSVNLDLEQHQVMEGDAVNVTVKLVESMDMDVPLQLNLTSDTAEDTDYDSSSPIDLNIPVGQTMVPYSIKTFEDEDAEDETFTISIDSTNLPYPIIAGRSGSVQVTILDKDAARISAPESLDIQEGESVDLSVSLTAQPSGPVTLKISGYTNTDLVADPSSLEFQRSNYKTPQTVTLRSTEDEDLTNDQVTLTFTPSGGGYSASHTLEVEIIDNLNVNVTEDARPFSFTLWGNYPNPATDQTRIVFDLPEPAQISLFVIDVLGRTVKTQTYGWLPSNQRHALDLNTATLPSGIYYYTLYADGGDQLVQQRSQAMLVIQ